MGQTARVLKNVIIHQQGQLPVVADLRVLPAPGDVNLVCTNMRTTDGKRPTFVDHIDSWFVIPMDTVRFIEVPQASMAEAGEATQEPMSEAELEALRLADEAELAAQAAPAEPDPDLLARIRNL
jgi:hypothetical protein